VKRISDISSPAEVAIEIQREELRDSRLHRRAKVFLLACGCLAMADDVLARLTSLALLPWSWF
jgi:hypothetical protein